MLSTLIRKFAELPPWLPIVSPLPAVRTMVGEDGFYAIPDARWLLGGTMFGRVLGAWGRTVWPGESRATGTAASFASNHGPPRSSDRPL